MERKTSKSTCEQLEQTLSEHIQVLYLTHIGHKPNRVSCQLIDKTLTNIIEDSISKPVRLLADSGKQELAEQVQFNINKAFEPQMQLLIEEVIGVRVLDLLSNSKLHTGCTTIIAVLAATPKLGNPSSLLKVKQQTLSDSNNDK